MSQLNKCIGKINAGKQVIDAELRAEIMNKAAERAKTMPRAEAEKVAVRELADQAHADTDYILEQIAKQLKIAVPEKKEMKVKQAEAEPVKQAEPVKSEVNEIIQAPEAPANEYQRPADEVEPGVSPKARTSTTTEALTAPVQRIADKYLGEGGSKIVTDTAHFVSRMLGKLEFLNKVVDRVEPHLPSARKWHDALMASAATKGELERRADVIAQKAGKLSNDSRDRANTFIADSTVSQKWGFQPEEKTFGRKVAVDADMAKKWAALTKEEQHVVEAVFQLGEHLSRVRQALFKALGIDGIFAQRGKLDGPYAPLKRTGGYIGVLKSQKLLDAKRAMSLDASKENTERDSALKHSADDYVVRAFDTPGQARQFTLQNASKFAFTDHFTKTKYLEENQMSSTALNRVLSAVKADQGLDAKQKSAMEDTIRAMWLSSLDESNARQSQRHREAYAGFDPDMIKSTLNDAQAQAAYIANLTHGGDINQFFYDMKNEIKHPTTGHRVGADDFNLLADHHAQSMEYKATPIVDGITSLTSAWQLATSIPYHIANFTQTIMCTLPKLASDFGAGNYTEAWGHVMDGYKQMRAITKDGGVTMDLSLVKDKGLREALEIAANRQLLDVGMGEDLAKFNRFATGYKALDGASDVAQSAMHRLRIASSAVERWNRVSAGTAAYNMAIAKGKSVAEAKKYVISVLEDTQGDFTRIGSPLVIKQLPKFITQYRKFQLMMMAQYTKATVAAFRGANKEERAVGMRFLAFKMAHTAVAGGVMGLPFMGLLGWIYDQWDQPEDLNTRLKRSVFGDGALGQLVQHGALPGVLAAKLDDSKVFSPLPYTKIDFSSPGGLAKTVLGAMGPAAGQAGRMATGVGLIQQGDFYKGTEKLMPRGLEAAMISYRLANEGFTLKNGDVLVKPSDISDFAIAMQVAGVPPDEVRNLTQNQSVQYKIRQYFQDNTKQMEHAYTKAAREKDTAAMAEIKAAWMELQKEKAVQAVHYKNMPDVLKHQPLSTLIGAPSRAAQREQKERGEYKAI